MANASPGVLWLAAALAAFIIFLAYIEAVRGPGSGSLKLSSPLGPVSWKFSDSWASSFTLIEGALAAFFAGALLPNSPRHMPGPMYQALAAGFAVMALTAPLVYRGFSRTTADPDNAGYQGTVAGFLAAGLLTLWAVIGQAFTAILMAFEAVDAEDIERQLGWVLLVLFLVVTLAMVAYGFRSVRDTLSDLGRRSLLGDDAPRAWTLM